MPQRLDKRPARLAMMRYGADAKRVRQLFRDALVARKQGQEVDLVEWLVHAALLSPQQAAEIQEALDQTQIDPRAPLRAARMAENGAFEVDPRAVARRSRYPATPAPETIVEHRVLRKLGEGGMGDVYLAYDQSKDRLVAIKLLWPHLADTPALVERFKREAEHSLLLNHPNIVRGLGSGFEPIRRRHFLVMEYVDGPSVQSLLDQQGKFAIGDAVHIALGVARALQHAQSHNIVHRDIKPENILITKSGVPKLADLGLSKATDQVSNLTAARQGFGTPFYMPYEQAMSARNADGRSDIFALGATLYHMVTGQVPFKGENQIDVLERKEAGAYPPASLVNPEVPEALDNILDKMLARDPRDRYQTPSDLIVDLERARLAAPVLSFVDKEAALADPYYRSRVAPTQLDVVAPSRSQEDLWFIRYVDREGKTKRIKASTSTIVSAIRKRRLTGAAEASRTLEGQYWSLDTYDPFRRALRATVPPEEIEKQPAEKMPTTFTSRYVLAGVCLGIVLVALLLYFLLP